MFDGIEKGETLSFRTRESPPKLVRDKTGEEVDLAEILRAPPAESSSLWFAFFSRPTAALNALREVLFGTRTDAPRLAYLGALNGVDMELPAITSKLKGDEFAKAEADNELLNWMILRFVVC